MTSLRRSILVLSFTLLFAACGDDDAPPPVDGGSGSDMSARVDGNLPDAGAVPDSAAADGAAGDGGGATSDGAVADLGGAPDAATADGGATTDSGTSVMPVVCGGRAGARCSDTSFCDYTAAFDCGFSDGTGTCRPRPLICSREFIPVCGCDGVTYSNGCSAQAAGTDIQAMGDCPAPPPAP